MAHLNKIPFPHHLPHAQEESIALMNSSDIVSHHVYRYKYRSPPSSPLSLEPVTPPREYRTYLTLNASSTPEAGSIAQKRVFSLTHQGSVETQSPISRKRVRVLSVGTLDKMRDVKSVLERLSSIEKSLSETQTNLAETKERLGTMQAHVIEMQAKVTRLRTFQRTICNGEVVSAVYTFLGHSAASQMTKIDKFRSICKKYDKLFARVRQSLPSLDEAKFERMLHAINPTPQNPVAARNHAAHKFTVAEARESAEEAGEFSGCLRSWVEVLVGVEGHDAELLDEIAYTQQQDFEQERIAKPICDMESFLAKLDTSPPALQMRVGRRLFEIIENARTGGIGNAGPPGV